MDNGMDNGMDNEIGNEFGNEMGNGIDDEICNNNCNTSNGCCGGGCADERDHCGCEGNGRLMLLSTEGGQEIPCAIISIFKVDEMGYIALRQINNNEILIFRYTEDSDGTVNMDNIKTDKEFDQVSEAFKNSVSWE